MKYFFFQGLPLLEGFLFPIIDKKGDSYKIASTRTKASFSGLRIVLLFIQHFFERIFKMEKKFSNPALDWGWKHLIPKTWPSIVWTFFVLISLAGSYYYFKVGTETPYREKVVFENPLKHPTRVVPARLDLGNSLFSGKKAVSVEISSKDFDEKKFPLVFMETDAASLALCFWGIDDQGVFHFSRLSVDPKDRAFLKITNVSFSPDFRKMEISYAVNKEMLLKMWLLLMSCFLLLTVLLIVAGVFRKMNKEFDRNQQQQREDREKTGKF